MQTYKVPTIGLGPVDIPAGVYQPSELKVYPSGVDCIAVGTTCPICHLRPWWWRPGHTHVFSNRNAVITLAMGQTVFDAPGVVSDLFVHEYCHAVRGLEVDGSLPENEGHDAKWGELMRKFGLEPSKDIQWTGPLPASLTV